MPVVASEIPAWNAMRRHLYRLRESAMPPSPKSAAEIVAAYENEEILRLYGMSLAGGGVESAPFYRKVYSCDQFAYCIFASHYIIQQIKDLEQHHIHMDGTFRVVPYGQFTQLLIMHITFFDKVHFSRLFFSNSLIYFCRIFYFFLFQINVLDVSISVRIDEPQNSTMLRAFIQLHSHRNRSFETGNCCHRLRSCNAQCAGQNISNRPIGIMLVSLLPSSETAWKPIGRFSACGTCIKRM